MCLIPKGWYISDYHLSPAPFYRKNIVPFGLVGFRGPYFGQVRPTQVLRRPVRQRVPVHPGVLHDEAGRRDARTTRLVSEPLRIAADGGNILERIAVDQQNVGIRVVPPVRSKSSCVDASATAGRFRYLPVRAGSTISASLSIPTIPLIPSVSAFVFWRSKNRTPGSASISPRAPRTSPGISRWATPGKIANRLTWNLARVTGRFARLDWPQPRTLVSN